MQRRHLREGKRKVIVSAWRWSKLHAVKQCLALSRKVHTPLKYRLPCALRIGTSLKVVPACRKSKLFLLVAKSNKRDKGVWSSNLQFSNFLLLWKTLLCLGSEPATIFCYLQWFNLGFWNARRHLVDCTKATQNVGLLQLQWQFHWYRLHILGLSEVK